eukprot:TRINITY_DN17763_c0_g1_i2.p2 TRINITY_DN17763_c0_g1~~TRINITY_DN17763_c0_g1_i2.p2  ORF type:complete len:245 (+),score=73.50 TRINITY_DN17763_c0_g1_i2:89-736(+)
MTEGSAERRQSDAAAGGRPRRVSFKESGESGREAARHSGRAPDPPDPEDADFPRERAPPAVACAPDSAAQVSLGFLKCRTVYHAAVYLDPGPGAAPGVLSLSGAAQRAPQSPAWLAMLGCRAAAAAGGAEGELARCSLRITPVDDGELRCDGSLAVAGQQPRRIVFTAHIIGERDAHTVMLAPGVRRVSRIVDCETDAESDWQGFDLAEEEDDGR